MAEEQKKTDKERLARGVVARGHTVAQPHPTEKRILGANPETGLPIYGSKMLEFGPGQEVTMPESELVSLRALGYFIDPNKSAAEPIAEGSHYKEMSS